MSVNHLWWVGLLRVSRAVSLLHTGWAFALTLQTGTTSLSFQLLSLSTGLLLCQSLLTLLRFMRSDLWNKGVRRCPYILALIKDLFLR